jgi:hypothetical protein
MVLVLDKKIVGSEISNYFTIVRDCFFSGNSFVLQPKTGVVTFNLSQYIGCVCSINFRRDSGNGLFLISNNGKQEVFQISSKTSQVLSFKIGTNGTLNINRTSRSRGELSIIDISILTETKSVSEFEKEFEKCIDSNNIRYQGDRLYAYEASFIIGRNVKVKTKPENCYKLIDANRVEFTGECEIVDLLIEEKQDDKPIILTSSPITNISNEKQSNALFDSKASGFEQKYCTNLGEVSGSVLFLDYRDSYILPLPFLRKDQKFSVIVEVSSVNGNGMFGLCITPGTEILWQVSSKNTTNFTLQSTAQVDSDNALSIVRHPAAKGKIQITSLTIISDSCNYLMASKIITPIVKKEEIPKQTIVKQCSTNKITNTVKKFSRPINHKYMTTGQVYENVKTIYTNTYNGYKWLEYCHLYLPNVQIKDNADVSISGAGNLLQAKTMFIEPFNELSDSDLNVISKAEKIIVSSQNNALEILDKTSKKTIVSSKKLPFVKTFGVPYINNGFILINNRNYETTSLILSKINGQRAIVLNARGRYPDFIIPVNEYIQYDELCYLFENTYCFIDFVDIEDEQGSFIDLAKAYGKMVITSSWAYMDDPSIVFCNDINSFTPDKITSLPGGLNKNDGFIDFAKELFD